MSASNSQGDRVGDSKLPDHTKRSTRRSYDGNHTSGLNQQRTSQSSSTQWLEPPASASQSHQRSQSTGASVSPEWKTVAHETFENSQSYLCNLCIDREECDHVKMFYHLKEDHGFDPRYSGHEFKVEQDRAASPASSSSTSGPPSARNNVWPGYDDTSSSETGYKQGSASPYNKNLAGSKRNSVSPLASSSVLQWQQGVFGHTSDDSNSILEEQPHQLAHLEHEVDSDPYAVQNCLPESYKWDVQYRHHHAQGGGFHRSWTCTPSAVQDIPLTIAAVPVVIPVEHRWPPLAGTNSSPDPCYYDPIDCREPIADSVIRVLFDTFTECIGFYILINGLIQVIMPQSFDLEAASQNMPSTFGRLRVCYISESMEPTTSRFRSRPQPKSPGKQVPKPPKSPGLPILQLNSLIEARAKTGSGKGKFEGRIGLRVRKRKHTYLLISTHVVTESLLTKSRLSGFGGHSNELKSGWWKARADIFASDKKVGNIHYSWDEEPAKFPKGFKHDVSMIQVDDEALIEEVKSPIQDLGWLSLDSWECLRRHNSANLQILGITPTLEAKTIRTGRPSDVRVVGEGIFLNRQAAERSFGKTLSTDRATWEDFLSRALLYRVNPDFDQPFGYSGIALYVEGRREDGRNGPGVAGFQSFVQRSGHSQSFDMEGHALEQRLEKGTVAFYGAFQVPEKLRKDWEIV